jgi:hypothetical protein
MSEKINGEKLTLQVPIHLFYKQLNNRTSKRQNQCT